MLTARPSLSRFRFSAKIDYVTFTGICKTKLPKLDGTARWPASFHGKRLTIHDATATDIKAVIKIFPKAPLVELEIAVDIRPADQLGQAARQEQLSLVKREYVSKGLNPRFIKSLNGGFRGAYRKTDWGYELNPFNRRVPGVSEQLLYGHRNDGTQVKCYYKGVDMKKHLPWQEHTVRVEVRLGVLGLNAHGLFCAHELLGFRYRKSLTPYFQHTCGVEPKCSRVFKNSSAFAQLLLKKQSDIETTHWKKIGVGNYLKGGFRAKVVVRHLRDTEINNRIGQAILRLERTLS